MDNVEGVQALPVELDADDLTIGIVIARFSQEIVDGLLKACVDELIRLGVAPEDIVVASVPGALEVPITLQRLGDSGRFDALVALGAVLRGETYHFEIVSNESASGITAVQLETGIPVANGILTCDTEEQARARMQQKGVDCAQAAVQMARLMEAIDEGQ